LLALQLCSLYSFARSPALFSRHFCSLLAFISSVLLAILLSSNICSLGFSARYVFLASSPTLYLYLFAVSNHILCLFAHSSFLFSKNALLALGCCSLSRSARLIRMFSDRFCSLSCPVLFKWLLAVSICSLVSYYFSLSIMYLQYASKDSRYDPEKRFKEGAGKASRAYLLRFG